MVTLVYSSVHSSSDSANRIPPIPMPSRSEN